MVYKDRQTLNSWSKSVEKTEFDYCLSNRSYKRDIDRKREQSIATFSQNVKRLIDPDLWVCISLDDRLELHTKWCGYYSKTGNSNLKEWLDNNIKNKVNYSQFRNIKLNKLLK